MRVFCLRFLFVACVLGPTFACSGTDGVFVRPDAGDSSDAASRPRGPESGGGSGSQNPPNKDASSSDSGARGTDGAADPSCGAMATLSACQSCCYAGHSAGTVYLVEEMASCECGPNGPCQSECAATLCATPVVAADAPCTTCVGGNLTGVCSAVLTACNEEPDCAALLACLGTCTGKR
jgi:hypothetical protein